MKNLLELGKSMEQSILKTYKDSYYEYVDFNSLDDETYIKIGKKLFNEKDLFLDYMNHIYLEDFNWYESEVNSFDYILDLVYDSINESKKYNWNEDIGKFMPIIKN